MIDDHKLFLAGLRDIVNKEEDMEVVGAAGCGKEGIVLAQETKPDVVVLDLAMPDMSGFEVASVLQDKLPETKLAALTMYLDRRMIYEALKANIRAYILKEASPQEFICALRVLTGGEIYLSPKVTTLIIADYMQLMGKSTAEETVSSSSRLSTREKEVLKMLVQGKSTRSISDALHISKSTVDTHRRNILDKVGCENVSCLVRYALREGLVNLDE
jgi:DNA-binding NarL/FixJ family response regulator